MFPINVVIRQWFACCFWIQFTNGVNCHEDQQENRGGNASSQVLAAPMPLDSEPHGIQRKDEAVPCQVTEPLLACKPHDTHTQLPCIYFMLVHADARRMRRISAMQLCRRSDRRNGTNTC